MLTFRDGDGEAEHAGQHQRPGVLRPARPDADKNGLTVWMPSALYIPAASPNVEAAKDFLNFVASVEGCQAMIGADRRDRPYLIKGCALPADVPPSVGHAALLPDRRCTAPALEFLSPIKGPALEQITVEVGSGIRPAAEASGAL
jgi:raffinose/stachyose/melibiose transport system substrate-binding protein